MTADNIVPVLAQTTLVAIWFLVMNRLLRAAKASHGPVGLGGDSPFREPEPRPLWSDAPPMAPRLNAASVVIGFVLFYLCQMLAAVAAIAMAAGLDAFRNPALMEEVGSKINPANLFACLAMTQSAFIAVTTMLMRFMYQTPISQLGFHRRHLWKSVLFGVLQMIAWTPITLMFAVWLSALAPSSQDHPAVKLVKEILGGAMSNRAVALLAVVVIVIVPLAEELLFRSVLLDWLRQRMPTTLAILASGVAFGVAHGLYGPEPIALSVLGAGLGVAYVRTGSIWAPVAMHALHNAFTLVAMFSAGAPAGGPGS